MKWNSLIFIIGFLLAFAGGYFFFAAGDSSNDVPKTDDNTTEENAAEEENGAIEIPDEALSLSRNGCLSCHSVESLGIKAGSIGPDLTIAYSGVEGKHGKDLDSFLQSPTSAVMATVLADRPLEDGEREEIVQILKEASEKGEQMGLETTDSEEDSNEQSETDAED